jgi:hypothetical protein
MTPKMFVLLLGAMVFGFLLIVIGLRGRRINRHPTCRQCGFDLSGVLPASGTCPECGAGVKLARFVRIGQRRRILTLVVLGIPLLVLPCLPLGLVFFTTITRTDLGRYKPIPLLLWEAKNLGEGDVKVVGKQLHDRMLQGQLTDEEYGRVIDAAMMLQADQARPWTPEWADIVDQARLDGKLSKERLHEFWQHSPVIEWSARSEVRAGSEFTVLGEIKALRGTKSTNLFARLVLESMTIGGRVLKPKARAVLPWQATRTGNTEEQGIYLMGDLARAGFVASQVVRFTGVIPADAKPGVYDILVEIEIRVEEQEQSAARSAKKKPDKAPTHRLVRNVSVEVVSPEVDVVSLIAPTDDQTKALSERLAPQSLTLNDAGASNGWLMAQFSIGQLPVPICHRATLKLGDELYKLGTLTSGKGLRSMDDDGGMMYMGGSNQAGLVILQCFFNTKPPGISKGTLTFTPDREYAELSVDLSEIYGGEIVIDDVEVQSDGQRQRSLPAPSTGSFIWRLLGG